MKINAMPQHSPMMSSAASGKKGRQDNAQVSNAAPVEANDVTQTAMSAALEELRGDSQEVDHGKVAQMQALIASGNYRVDNDELSGAMLDFYRNK
ncbi:flagellar biosynthesis anti-sigma factor FlgM [Atlantibacter sp.]|uniref:flagellar biosynthesis anti-sigma factor FlgM n=1 Tax=Atlantibacter sp. TaxID=1903473 RepID=UPI00289BF20F|nr:flagellar biosynthesis anti-sigma factor FlgM [Atlantibacter sp.]